MTDKEIIIDGVNVAGCVNFRDDVYTDKQIYNACSIGLWQRHYKNLEDSCKLSCQCKDNPNCCYKHLYRTITQYNAVVEQNRNMQSELQCKTQECEELKNRASSLEEIADRLQKSNHLLTQENEKLKLQRDLYATWYKAKHNDIKGLLLNYHQALEQIQPKLQEIYDTAGCGATTYQERMVDEIQNIINEVKNDN